MSRIDRTVPHARAQGQPRHSPLAEQILGKRLYELDITGVEGMDDLLQPRRDQNSGKDCWLRHSVQRRAFSYQRYLIGLQTLILTVCNSGDKI